MESLSYEGVYIDFAIAMSRTGLSKGMMLHKSMRTVYEYVANEINAAGYWMAFDQ